MAKRNSASRRIADTIALLLIAAAIVLTIVYQINNVSDVVSVTPSATPRAGSRSNIVLPTPEEEDQFIPPTPGPADG